MLTTSPKVSVLVPVYNAEKFIAKTVQSVLNQTYKNFELILLDDGSTDNTEEIILSFNDKRIIYAKNKKNIGISASRNKLMSLADGAYCAILDHDDYCLPQRLEKQINFLEKHQNISLAGSWFELYCPDFAPLWRRIIVNLGWVWCHPLSPTIDDILKGNVVMHPTIMYRTKDIKAHHISYNEKYSPAEDYDFIRQTIKAGLTIANIPEILLKYSLYGGNCSLVKKQKMKQADKLVKEQLAADFKLKRPPFYPYFLVMMQKLRLKIFMRIFNV